MFPEIKFNNMIIGNPRSNIGLCVFWDKLENYKHLQDQYAIIGNLYGEDGIPYMLYNIAKSQICYIDLVLKYDLNKVWNNVRKKNYPKYTNVIEGCTWDTKDKGELICANNSSSTYDRREPIDAPHPCGHIKKDETKYSPAIPGHRIYDPDPLSAWRKALYKISLIGSRTKNKTKELKNLIVITNPEHDYMSCSNRHEFETKFIEKSYYDSFLDPNKPEFISYTYGQRICSASGTDDYLCSMSDINQIEYVIKKIKEDPETRQACISIYDPAKDFISSHPPCLVFASFLPRDEVIDMTLTVRSHDIYRAWLNNYAAASNLQQHIADKTKMNIGQIIIHSQSAHIYEENILDAYNQSLKLKYRPVYESFYISFIKSENTIFVEIKDWNHNVLDKFSETDKKAITYRLGLIVSDVNHAMYLGRELEKL